MFANDTTDNECTEEKKYVYIRELRIHFLNILTIIRRRKAIKKSAEYKKKFYFFIFIRGD